MAIAIFSFVLIILILPCSAKRPNILFIVADDLGFNDIGFRNPDMITPTLDKLAQDGVILDSAYVLPVCSPSRSAFMSGTYPYKTGLQHIVIGGRQAVCLPLHLTILPQQLKKVGYATHIVGKFSFNSRMAKWTYPVHYLYEETGFYDLHDGLKPAVEYNGTYSTYVFTNRITSIINQHDTNTPLFMYLPFQNVHAPIEVPEKYENMYPHVGNLGRRKFSGMVTILDEAIKNITDRLKERGMFEDTLILFTADNGGELYRYGNNWPLRGGKHTLWEGGTRVTAFMSGTGLTQTGITYTGMIHAVDYMATLIGAAGAEQVSKIDGINQWDSIRLNQPSKRTEFIYNLDEFNIPSQGVAAIRVGDWKLILGYPGRFDGWYHPMNDTEDITLIQNIYNSGDSSAKLFNLSDDPRELTDVSSQHPDIVTKLINRINQYRNARVQANYPASDPKAAEFAHENGGVWASGWC